MTKTAKAIVWAVLILCAALLAKTQGMSNDASFALIMVLTGAALASIGSVQGTQARCGRSCS